MFRITSLQVSFAVVSSLIDVQQVSRPGTLLVFLEPLYEGGLDGVTPGSSCIANAYTNNHDIITSPDTGVVRAILLHVVDALALVHALILRLQALDPSIPELSCSADTNVFGRDVVYRNCLYGGSTQTASGA